MFNFSANHLRLLARTEYRSCAVLLMQDRDTRRVYRLYDFTKTQLIPPDTAYCIAGKVNSPMNSPADRIGPAGHQTRSTFQCSCSC
jgi:hypothetical protein